MIRIDEHLCTKCGLCARACPVGIIVLGESFPETIEKIEKGCITCGHCVAACPVAALSHCRMKPDECSYLADNWRSTPDTVEQLIKGRRSIRRFCPEPVERNVINRILDIVRYAPTGMNSQSVHWLAILDPEEIKRYSTLVIEWLRMLQGQGYPGIKGALKAWEMGNDPILRKAPCLLIAHGNAKDPVIKSSATIALTTLELAALPFGLGTCWAGFLQQAANNSFEVLAALGLPPGHRMFGGVMVGYPEFSYSRIPQRKPATVIWR